MNETQEAAVLEAALDDLGADPTAEQIIQTIEGFSELAVAAALKRTGGGGGSQSSQPVAITVTASEIAARWYVANTAAYVETDAIAPGDCCLVTAIVEDTLDGDTQFLQLVAYLPGASSEDVDNGNDQLAGVAGTYTPSTYASGGVLPDLIPYTFLNEGAAAYLSFSGSEPPTTGQVTVAVLRAT